MRLNLTPIHLSTTLCRWLVSFLYLYSFSVMLVNLKPQLRTLMLI